MRKFSKENFLSEFKKEDTIIECACNLEEEETISELVDDDGSMIDGSVPDGNEMNIQPGPVQKPSTDFSTYEKGMATTTDKARMDISQGNTWMRAFTGLGGTNYSHGIRGIGDWNSMMGSMADGMESFGSFPDVSDIGENVEELEENMKDMVEAILSADNGDKDFVKKGGDNDMTDKTKLDDLVSKIKDLSPEDKEKLGKLLSDAK